jgi:hypothetical protein
MEISRGHAQNVCRIGQGWATCRYIAGTHLGFRCQKLNPDMRAYIDRRVAMHDFKARGDNCDGKPSDVDLESIP